MNIGWQALLDLLLVALQEAMGRKEVEHLLSALNRAELEGTLPVAVGMGALEHLFVPTREAWEVLHRSTILKEVDTSVNNLTNTLLGD